MKKTFTTMAAAAAVWALMTLPATAQSSGSGSSGSGSSEQGGSSSGSNPTDQQGSSQGDQVGSGGTGQSGSGQTGTSGQSGTGQSGSGAGSGSTAGQTGTTGSSTGTHAGSATGAKGSSQDRTFIMEAAAGGMAEVELGRLASQKASSSEVKQFGQMMVDDHTKANDQLMKIAQTKGFAAPHALKPQDQATQDRLSKLSGEAFDRAYMQHMVQDHKKDVSLFRKQSTSASDAEVKQFASSTLPTLEKHLSRAQEIAQTVGGGSDSAKGTSGKATTTGTKKSTHGSGASGSGASGSGAGASGSGSSGTGATPPSVSDR